MKNKHCWLVCWLEKYADGSVNAFKTAVRSETLARAAQIAGDELAIRARAQPGTQVLIYDVGIAEEDCADLIGKAETDKLGIDWPE